MRIIAGKYKRTPLITLEGDLTRPTKDMVKEALFSSIYVDENTCFLDVFSGSGSIGLEALSRGADEVIFNDINKDAVRIIKENLNKVKENREVYNLDWAILLDRIKGKQFDYIYIDPPYAFLHYDELIEKILNNDLLKEDGTIIVEVIKDKNLKENYQDLKLYKEKKYGINKLIYYKR